MSKIIYIGATNGKGGISSVLNEYFKMFPKSIFVNTTSSSNCIFKFFYGISATFKCFYLPILYPKSIFHIHGSSYNSFTRKYIYFKILSFFKAKIIYHIHGAEYNLFYNLSNNKTKNKIKYVINNAHCLICLSSFWKDFFLKNFNPKKIEIIPNPVPQALIKHKINNKKINFLFLGHISKRKGVYLLLEVIESMKEKLMGKAVFNFGGNGEIENFQNIIKNKNLEGIVNNIGWVSDQYKAHYFSQADIFILPSYNEGLPVSILEAMTYSLPIISSNVGGIPEIVKHKINGLLIEPGNSNELEESINFVLENNSKIKNYGRASFKLVKPYFSENSKSKLIKVYNSI